MLGKPQRLRALRSQSGRGTTERAGPLPTLRATAAIGRSLQPTQPCRNGPTRSLGSQLLQLGSDHPGPTARSGLRAVDAAEVQAGLPRPWAQASRSKPRAARNETSLQYHFDAYLRYMILYMYVYIYVHIACVCIYICVYMEYRTMMLAINEFHEALTPTRFRSRALRLP